MRIAWFTPFHKTSAIGRFSRYVTEQLAKSAEVDIWRPPAEEIHPTSLRTFVCSEGFPLGPRSLAGYDLCFYNMGNYLPYHRTIYEVSQRVPGVVVLHDFILHHFFTAYYLTERKAPEQYVEVMSRTYGNAGRQIANSFISGKAAGVWDTDRVLDFPLFEPAIRGAFGVVVHSGFFREAAAKVFSGPVKRLFLAYEAPAGDHGRLSRRELHVPEDKLLVVTVGHVNPNKRVRQVIEAIGRHKDLARQIIYAVVGPVAPAYGQELRELVAKYDLEESVRFTGYASDDVLSSYLSHADICVNLRYPSTEGASASAIEEMLYGKPLIVSRTGFFCDLPDDVVCTIDTNSEVADIRRALWQLVGNSRLREEMGKRAMKFARQQADAGRYAAGILEFANEILDGAPILRLTDRMAAQLAAMAVAPDMPLVATIAENTHELFCANGQSKKPLPK